MESTPGTRRARTGATPATAFEDLKAMIIRGHIAPGMRLTENDIASRMGLSRTPAREALQRLRTAGLMVPVREGARRELAVAPLTREDLEEVYALMGALEGAAARRVGTLSPAQRRDVHAAMRDAEAAFEEVAKNDPRSFDRMFTAHNAVHEAFIQSCAGPRLRDVLAVMRPLADRYEWVYAPLVGPDFRETFTEHRAIMEAVKRGDADAAEAAVRANWTNSAARLLEAFARWGGRGGWALKTS